MEDVNQMFYSQCVEHGQSERFGKGSFKDLGQHNTKVSLCHMMSFSFVTTANLKTFPHIDALLSVGEFDGALGRK